MRAIGRLPGWGLDLGKVRRMVSGHGGQVSATSRRSRHDLYGPLTNGVAPSGRSGSRWYKSEKIRLRSQRQRAPDSLPKTVEQDADITNPRVCGPAAKVAFTRRSRAFPGEFRPPTYC